MILMMPFVCQCPWIFKKEKVIKNKAENQPLRSKLCTVRVLNVCLGISSSKINRRPQISDESGMEFPGIDFRVSGRRVFH